MAQIKKGFIAPNAIDGSKLRLLNNEAFRALAADGSDVEVMKVDVNSVLKFLRMPQVSSDPSSGDDVTRKSYVDSEVSAEESRAMAAEGVLQDNIDAEQSARESADTTLQSNIDAEQSARESGDAGLQSAIDQEVSDRQAAVSAEQSARESADTTLQSNIDVEKGRIDAILAASDADKDSFAEIVALINSVDTENDNAFAAYALSNDAALAQEVSDRQAADTTLQGNIDAEQASREAEDTNLHGRINTEEAARQAEDENLATMIGQEISDRQAAVSAEESARQSADNALDARLDVLEADPTTKSYVDSADSALDARIDSLEASSSGDLAAEAAAREAADQALDARLDTLEADPTTKTYVDSAVSSEQSAREAADTSLQNQINDILSNVDPSALDSLSEIVQAFQDADSDLSAAITSALGTHTSELNTEIAAREAADTTLQSNIDAEESARESADTTLQNNIDSEASARQSADDALDARVDALEAVSEGREKFTVSQTDLDNQYFDLDHVAKPDSTFMFYGPLYLHEGDDYTVSTVGGVSRLTFAGRIASGQPSQPIVGDVIYVRYKY